MNTDSSTLSSKRNKHSIELNNLRRPPLLPSSQCPLLPLLLNSILRELWQLRRREDWTWLAGGSVIKLDKIEIDWKVILLKHLYQDTHSVTTYLQFEELFLGKFYALWDCFKVMPTATRFCHGKFTHRKARSSCETYLSVCCNVYFFLFLFISYIVRNTGRTHLGVWTADSTEKETLTICQNCAHLIPKSNPLYNLSQEAVRLQVSLVLFSWFRSLHWDRSSSRAYRYCSCCCGWVGEDGLGWWVRIKWNDETIKIMCVIVLIRPIYAVLNKSL